MLLLKYRASRIAELFALLEQGERIAHDAAQQQARLAILQGMPQYAGFFRQQARHENFHAYVFHKASRWLNSKHHHKPNPQLAKIQDAIVASLESRHLGESVLGVQIVLESIGNRVLNGIDCRMRQHRLGLNTIRKTILAQETAHHQFGHENLSTLIQRQAWQDAKINRLGSQYQELVYDLFNATAGLFESLDADIEVYKAGIRAELAGHMEDIT